MRRRTAGVAVAVGLCFATPACAGEAEWRTSAGGVVNGLAVIDTGGGPEQRPGADATLRLDAASGTFGTHLELRSRIGGPFVGGSGVGVYDFDDTFQNRSPALELPEAWVEARTRRVEVRAGLQRFAWGKLDGAPPTDVLNPRDYHDPIVAEFEDRKIGVPALAGTWYPDLGALDALHDLRVQLAWIPFAVPPRLALARERWFARSTQPPTRIPLTPSTLRGFGLCDMDPATPDACSRPQAIRPVTLETVNDTPPRTLAESAVALRIGGTWRETDWDLYHYTGPETGPVASLRPVLFVRPGETLTDPTRLPLAARSRLVQDRRTIHMTGGDLAAPIGGFTLRAEVAHFLGRPYLRVAGDLLDPSRLRDLSGPRILRALQRHGRAGVDLGELFPSHDAVEWGIGIDYLWNGWLPLLQLNQVVPLGAAERLVVSDPETRLTASLKKKLFDERIEIELRAACGIDRGWWFVMPRVGYRVRDDLRLRAGYLAIGGPRASYLGQFSDDDEVLFQVQYSY